MPTTDAKDGNRAAGLETARLLLDIKAVNFRPEEPYMLTSGWASPVYIDCRKLISFPGPRSRVIALAVEMLAHDGAFDGVDAVAGGETAGIPYAAWIAEARNMPMLYVRKQPKGFGRNAQIEGDIDGMNKILLIEDLATDGASKVNFVNALRTAETEVSDAFVVFFYGVFPGATEALAEIGIRLHYLATWRDVLEAAETDGFFTPEAIAGVRKFLDDPIAWSVSHGGKGAD